MIKDTNRTLSISLEHEKVNFKFMITAVYAKCSRRERLELWKELEEVKPVSNMPWLVGGDFNVVARESEKIGGRDINRMAVQEFNDAINNCGLLEMNCTGNRITWCNNRRGRDKIRARLDRVLCNSEWIGRMERTHYQHLNRTHSDHAPMVICAENENTAKRVPFRFLNIWTRHESFLEVVSNCWSTPVQGNFMRQVSEKLKLLSKDLKLWNKEKFGDIFKKTLNAEKEVEIAEITNDIEDSDSSLIKLNLAKAKLVKHLADEEEYWRQKANIKYVLEDNNNTNFFHNTVKGRRNRNYIHRIKNQDGVWVEDKQDIKEHIVKFYQNQLSSEGYRDVPDDMLECIPKMITEEENDELTKWPEEKEVKEAVWSLNKDSAAGLDGFNGFFFQYCWQVVKGDLVKAITEFFAGACIPKAWTSSSIVLIPKIHKPVQCSQLRPISLENFIQKIISKILATRLSLILPKIISPYQTGFVKGRNIADNIMIAQEMINHINKKSRGNNVAIKLDMEKAYDRVNWFWFQ